MILKAIPDDGPLRIERRTHTGCRSELDPGRVWGQAGTMVCEVRRLAVGETLGLLIFKQGRDVKYSAQIS